MFVLTRPALTVISHCWPQTAWTGLVGDKITKKIAYYHHFLKKLWKKLFIWNRKPIFAPKIRKIWVWTRLTITVPVAHTIRTANGSFYELWLTKHQELYKNRLNCLRIAGCCSVTRLSLRNASSVSVISVWKHIGGNHGDRRLFVFEINDLSLQSSLTLWIRGTGCLEEAVADAEKVSMDPPAQVRRRITVADNSAVRWYDTISICGFGDAHGFIQFLNPFCVAWHIVIIILWAIWHIVIIMLALQLCKIA